MKRRMYSFFTPVRVNRQIECFLRVLFRQIVKPPFRIILKIPESFEFDKFMPAIVPRRSGRFRIGEWQLCKSIGSSIGIVCFSSWPFWTLNTVWKITNYHSMFRNSCSDYPKNPRRLLLRYVKPKYCCARVQWNSRIIPIIPMIIMAINRSRGNKCIYVYLYKRILIFRGNVLVSLILSEANA